MCTVKYNKYCIVTGKCSTLYDVPEGAFWEQGNPKTHPPGASWGPKKLVKWLKAVCDVRWKSDNTYIVML